MRSPSVRMQPDQSRTLRRHAEPEIWKFELDRRHATLFYSLTVEGQYSWPQEEAARGSDRPPLPSMPDAPPHPPARANPAKQCREEQHPDPQIPDLRPAEGSRKFS